jgi:hypothetical protein
MLGAMIGLSACGSGTPKHAVRRSGEASKPPDRIVADAAAAIRSARGYAMQGTMSQNGQAMRFAVVVPGASSLELTFSIAGATIETIVSPSASYVRGNAAFWRAHFGGSASGLANRWIQVAPSSAQTLTSSLGHFAPATVARCLTEDHGTLTVAGMTTIDGRAAVIVRDKGNAPGSSPGELDVAATGPPYPLQATADGVQRAGGPIDVCNDGKATHVRGQVSFGHFGAVPPLQAPKHAIRLGQTLNA